MIGWLNTVGAIVELPMMLLADRVLHRKGSAFTLKLAFWVSAISLIFIVAHPSLISFFFYRIICGIADSFMVVSFTVFIVERAPAQQSATVLALYTITIAGVVNILFSPISGMIFDAFGAYWLYVLAMAGYIIGAVIFHLMVREKKVTTRA